MVVAMVSQRLTDRLIAVVIAGVCKSKCESTHAACRSCLLRVGGRRLLANLCDNCFRLPLLPSSRFCRLNASPFSCPTAGTKRRWPTPRSRCSQPKHHCCRSRSSGSRRWPLLSRCAWGVRVSIREMLQRSAGCCRCWRRLASTALVVVCQPPAPPPAPAPAAIHSTTVFSAMYSSALLPSLP